MRGALLSVLFALAACATAPDDVLAEVTIRATVPEHSGPVYPAGAGVVGRLIFDPRILDRLYAPYQREMLPVMRDLGYVDGATLEARVYPGANHNETAWRARLREPLTFLLRRRGAAH